MFGKKKKPVTIITLFAQDTIVFSDTFEKLPFAESVILEKSMFFFRDPEPCYIHRGAVAIRLASEIAQETAEHDTIEDCPLLLQYLGRNDLTAFEISERS